MSQTGAAALPDPQTAYQNLFQGVHAQVFFQKLAAAGHYPRSQEEAQWMLDTAGELREISQHDQVKQAAAQDNPYYQMRAGLSQLRQQYGITGGQAGFQEAEAGYKQAAAELMQDPTFYNSVLSLKAAEAEQLKAEFDAWKAANPNG